MHLFPHLSSGKFLSTFPGYIYRAHMFHNMKQAFPSLSLPILRALAKSDRLGCGQKLFLFDK